MSEKRVLICDKCSAENWNLASEGKSHDQRANEVKGYDDCDGVWRNAESEAHQQSEIEATERRRQFRIVKGSNGKSE